MLNDNFKIGTDRSNRNQIKRMANRFGDEFILAKAAELVELVRSGWNEATDLHETLDMRKYA